MKKFCLFSLLILSLGIYGCGGGSGSASTPPGENPGTPSELNLRPAQFIAQTNSSIFLRARVLDGNGHPLPNVPVFFTNCAPFGTLSSTSVNTDKDGFATVSLFSTMVGFATVQAEMNVGSNQVRDKKTVFFSPFEIAIPGQSSGGSMSMEVDSNFNEVFSETADFTLLDTTGDDQAMIRITTNNSGESILVGSDDTSEVKFMPGESSTALVTTDTNGQASVLIKVVPTFLTNATRVINITASDSVNGASGMISLFLDPVTLNSGTPAKITVSANPKSVDSGGSSDITAYVTTSAGTPAPDGTSVIFSATLGGVDMFGQTTDGVATASYKAPTVTASATDTVTAKAGGLTGSVNIGIVVQVEPPTPAALTIVPGTATVITSTGGTVTFTISGGTPPYVTSSTDPNHAYNVTAGNGIWSGSSVIVTVPGGTGFTGTVSLTVYDSGGSTPAVATLTIAP